MRLTILAHDIPATGSLYWICRSPPRLNVEEAAEDGSSPAFMMPEVDDVAIDMVLFELTWKAVDVANADEVVVAIERSGVVEPKVP